MSLRNIKKLQTPDFVAITDESEESEAAPRKSANNFELVRIIWQTSFWLIFTVTSTQAVVFFLSEWDGEMFNRFALLFYL